MNALTLGYALIGGLLPSFIWLYFLLKEDAQHPEPKKLIALAFVTGMAAVWLALPLEQYAKAHIQGGFAVLTAWALIEEFLKYAMAAIFLLWRHAVDEAPDYVIYMLTVALGFAAAENILFIAAPMLDGRIVNSFLTGNVRFLGSTLLHVVASAAVGFSFAFTVGSQHVIRMMAAAFGLILAITLHTTFNALIISQGANTTLTAFFLVWVVAVVFFAAFEILKYTQSRSTANSIT